MYRPASLVTTSLASSAATLGLQYVTSEKAGALVGLAISPLLALAMMDENDKDRNLKNHRYLALERFAASASGALAMIPGARNDWLVKGLGAGLSCLAVYALGRGDVE